MKIAIVSNYYFPEVGAAPNRITNMAKGLESIGHDVEVVCPMPNYPQGKVHDDYRGKISLQETMDSIRVNRFWIYPSRSPKAIPRILSMFSFSMSLWLGFFRFKKSNFDLVIIQNSPLMVSFSTLVLFKKLLRRKVALNVSDLWPLSALELGAVKEGRFYDLLLWIEKFNYRNSDMVLGQSQEITKHVRQIYPDKRLFVYRNLPLVSGDVAKRPLTRTSGFRLLYAGLLGVAQDVLSIATAINSQGEGIEFHIYGKGPQEDQIRELAEDSESIIYHGSLPSSELQKIIGSFQAAVVPLRTPIKGAVPSKIFELARFGVPVVFGGGGEGEALVKEHKIGLVYTPGDINEFQSALKKLVGCTDEEYEQYRNNCKKVTSSLFSFENQLNELIRFLN